MPSTSLSLNDILQHLKDEIGFNIDKLLFIRNLNRILIDLNITKPAERLQDIYFIKEFRKYPLPTEFRTPIGLRDISRTFINPQMTRVSPVQISQAKVGEMYAIQNDAPTQYLEILHNRTSAGEAVVTNADSLTVDGAWTAGAGASNLQINEVTKYSGSGSVSLDISGATATVTFVRTTALDILSFTENQLFGGFFWLPTVPTQISLRWGNDSSNYFAQTLTKQTNNAPLNATQMNELLARQNTATETGTVDLENVDWFQIVYTFSTSITDASFLIDRLVLAKPEVLPLEYYTKYVAQDADGAIIAKITESVGTTDVPLIFDDYLQTLIDGLAWRYFRKKKLELAEQYRRDYIATHAPSGALVSGKRFLDDKYPDRLQRIRRKPRLPAL